MLKSLKSIIKSKPWLLAIGLGLAGLVLCLFLIKGRPDYGHSITFKGVYVCLDHKNQNGPQTAECGGGFSSGSKVYEIDNADYYANHPDIIIGSGEYQVTGVLEPAGDFYASDGTIKVTDLKLVN